MKEGMHFEYHLARLVKMRGYFIAFGIMRKGTLRHPSWRNRYSSLICPACRKKRASVFPFRQTGPHLFRDALHWQAALLQKRISDSLFIFDPMF